MSDQDSKNEKKVLLYPDHPLPRTRRDFLKTGIIQFAATAVVPNILAQIMYQQKARAQCAPMGAAMSAMPFLVVDMAGGSALPGNFLVGKKGGPEDLMSSYDTLGWDPKAAGALDKSFGIPMAANASKILAGIKQTASPAAQANLRMGSFCNFSRDDTSDNPLSALPLVTKSGARGSLIPVGLGTVNSTSGGNSSDPLKDLTLKPLNINKVSDVGSSVSYGPAFQGFSDDVIKSMGKAIHDLSQDQLQKYADLNLGDQLNQIAGCAYEKNMEYGAKVQGVDAREDAIFQKAYGVQQFSNDTDTNAISATLVMNMLKGNTGPAAITIGGCDYHTGNQTTGDQKDLEAGQQIGRAIEAAYQMKKPLFFQLLTDGGVSAAPGTRNWSSDSSVRSATIIGFFDPNGAPKQQRLQVGSYVDGQAVDQTTLVGGEPAKVAYAVLANYLAASGKLADFNNVAPRGLFDDDQLKEILIFGEG